MEGTYDLSILIPARNEMFLARTVQDLLENIEGNTEIIVALDGQWSDPVLPQDPRVTVLFFPESIGQRAATNQAARISKAKYVMKVDAHCAFDKGFDVKMMDAFKELGDDVTMVPIMKNLHAFNWVCDCGVTEYQGATHPCPKCGSEMKREIVWKPRRGVESMFYRFDNTLHFQYWNEYKHRKEAQTDLAETLSIQGSCFMLTRDKYWELDICDEKHGSWGQQGVEVACKTWLSGGRVITNKRTWYAHMFRTQGGDFGFPYPNPGISKAREYSRDLWFNNKWPKAKHNLQWLIDKFAPVPDWHTPSKAILYYTCNTHDPKLDEMCRDQLKKAAKDIPIYTVSLNKELPFGTMNITLRGERSPEMMHKQIEEGLKHIDADIVYLCESDVMYHPSHFEFTPWDKDTFYYNTNVWRVRSTDGFAYRTDKLQQVSGMVVYTETLKTHFKERMEMIKNEGFSRRMGYEPFTHGRVKWPTQFKASSFESTHPNADIRHDKNITSSRWHPSQFRDQRHTKGWIETYDIPYWGKITI